MKKTVLICAGPQIKTALQGALRQRNELLEKGESAAAEEPAVIQSVEEFSPVMVRRPLISLEPWR